MRLNEFLAIQGLPRLALAFFFLQMQFWFPIWVLFLLDRGLSLIEIIIADMIFYGCIILFEVPAGMLGDSLGRKKTYFLGAILGAFSYALMMIITDFFLLIICWVTWSAFIAVVSGTDTAFIYEILVRDNQLEKSTFVFGYFSAIASGAFIITHFIAGYLYSIHSNLPIFMNVLTSFLAAIIIFTLPSPSKDYSTPTFRDILNAMTKAVRSNIVVRNSILVISILMMYYWTLTLIFQPFLIDLGVKVEFFGIIYFLFTALGVISGICTGFLEKKIGKFFVISLSTILLVIAVGVAGFIPGILSVFGIVWLRFAFYLGEPVLKVVINDQIEDANRASVFSFANMIYSLMLVFSRPLIGLITDISSPRIAFQVWFIFGVVLIIFSLILLRPILKLKEK